MNLVGSFTWSLSPLCKQGIRQNVIFCPDDFFTGSSRVQSGIDIVSGFIFNTKRKNKITKWFFGLPKIHFIINWYSSSDWGQKTHRQINRFVVVVLFFASLLPSTIPHTIHQTKNQKYIWSLSFFLLGRKKFTLDQRRRSDIPFSAAYHSRFLYAFS